MYVKGVKVLSMQVLLIQSNVSNVTHVKGVKVVFVAFMQMYTGRILHTCPLPIQEGKLLPFKKSPVLWVKWFTTKQSEEAALF